MSNSLGQTTVLLSISISLFLLGCKGESTDDSSGISEELGIEDTTSIIEAPIAIENQDEIFCFEGTIDDKYEIYLEYMVSYDTDNCSIINGFYYYTSNNIGFTLQGELCGNEISLNRFEDEKAVETFLWQRNENFGSWSMDGESKDLEINRTNPYSGNSEQFLEACQQINNQYENMSVTAIDYEMLNTLRYENSIFVEDEEYYIEFCGNKIYLSGSNENSGGGYTCTAIYALLNPLNKTGNMQLMHFEMMNAWTNDYGDMEIDEDDQYGLDPSYWAFLDTYSYSKGELSQNKNIEFSGEGRAAAYFFNDRLIIESEAGKDILSYSPEQGVFVEK